MVYPVFELQMLQNYVAINLLYKIWNSITENIYYNFYQLILDNFYKLV